MYYNGNGLRVQARQDFLGPFELMSYELLMGREAGEAAPVLSPLCSVALAGSQIWKLEEIYGLFANIILIPFY